MRLLFRPSALWMSAARNPRAWAATAVAARAVEGVEESVSGGSRLIGVEVRSGSGMKVTDGRGGSGEQVVVDVGDGVGGRSATDLEDEGLPVVEPFWHPC